jgi:hypothetical protein
MVDIFQKVLLYAALVGLAFLLPILFAKSKTILLVFISTIITFILTPVFTSG